MINLTGIILNNNTQEQIIRDLLLLISSLVIGLKLIELTNSYTMLGQIRHKTIIKHGTINKFLKVINKFIIINRLYYHKLIVLNLIEVPRQINKARDNHRIYYRQKNYL